MKASIKKPRAKAQTIKILEHIENTEQIATKNDITWLKWVLGLGFGTLFTIVMALGGLITYLHSDTKADMNRRFAEQKADMDRRFAELKTDMNKRFAELKADMKEIKRLLQKK